MSMHQSFTCPQEVGTYEIYRMYHEEMESLVKHIPTIRRAQFWMSFSPNYLKHLEVLQNVGMTRIDPVMYNGVEIIPLQFLKAVLAGPRGPGQDGPGEKPASATSSPESRTANSRLCTFTTFATMNNALKK